jgi:chemotaxis methyl-accepting protein methylase
MADEIDDGLLEEIAAELAALNGFRADGMSMVAIREAARTRLKSISREALLAECRDKQSKFHGLFLDRLSMGGSFFYRHPDHFRFLASSILPRLLTLKTPALRVWSAGCATGEEAYSLAACLTHHCPAERLQGVAILGTDILEQKLVVARNAVYSAPSPDNTEAMLYPLFEQVPDSLKVRVREDIRKLVTFSQQNLLELPPGGEASFQLIFCRNVFYYLSDDAARKVCANLLAALSPGGFLVLGPVEASIQPTGLRRVGPPELNVFMRGNEPLEDLLPDPRAVVRAARKAEPPAAKEEAPPPRPKAPKVKKPPAEVVAQHVKALGLIERGEANAALNLLRDLYRSTPDYLPALLELALLHTRHGQRGAATALMQELVRRTDDVPLEQAVPGPEELPISYYRATAEAFLAGARKR